MSSRRPMIGITEKNQGTYWDLVNAGWRDAAQRLGIELRIDAPEHENVETQRDLMRSQLNDSVDALAFVATRADGFDDIVAEAAARGVPAITFDLDAPSSGRIFFVGMETPTEVGRRLAQQMVADGITSGTVFLQNGSAKAPGARGKRDGLVEVLSSAGVRVVESEPDGEDEALAARLAQTGTVAIEDLSAAVGVYGYHPTVLAEATKGRNVPVYGYDLLPATMDLIADGEVRGTLWIRELEFGLHAAAALSDIVRLGIAPAMEIRGMDPVDWSGNRRTPPAAYVTAAELPAIRRRYDSIRATPS